MNDEICPCGSGLLFERLYDYQGIYCGRYCEKCEDRVRAAFRPETFTGYDQADCDEPIEPEE